MTNLALLLLALPAPGAAAPRIPERDDELLLRLGPRPPGLILAGRPAPSPSLEQALDQARALLQRAQQEADPRFLGYAEARLAPWSRGPALPASLRLLRARLYQARHQFAQARQELDRALALAPELAEAWLVKANLQQLQGDYAAALASCRHMPGLESLALALACQAQVQGLSGQGEKALASLQRLAAAPLGLSAEQAAWLQLSLADLADRLGRPARAEAAWRSAQVLGAEAVAGYADWLWRQGRHADTLNLLAPWAQQDGLLIYRERARRALGQAPSPAAVAAIAARLQAALRPGEAPHWREQALLALDLQGQPVRALELARRNWQQQKEPVDSRLYARAARAAQSSPDLALLARWQRQTGQQDRELSRLLAGARHAP